MQGRWFGSVREARDWPGPELRLKGRRPVREWERAVDDSAETQISRSTARPGADDRTGLTEMTGENVLTGIFLALGEPNELAGQFSRPWIP